MLNIFFNWFWLLLLKSEKILLVTVLKDLQLMVLMILFQELIISMAHNPNIRDKQLPFFKSYHIKYNKIDF